MSEIALASIKTFASAPQSNLASTSEESIFVIAASQLQSLITQAVEKAIQPLQEEVSQLRLERDQDCQEIATLRDIVASQAEKITAIENLEEQDVTRLALDIALDRQRISRLEEPKEPQPLQRDRGEILRALLAANGGKMLAKEARQKMRMDKASFSRLLATLKEEIVVKPLHSDKRKLLLIIK
jgi:uncharacterized membrane protein